MPTIYLLNGNMMNNNYLRSYRVSTRSCKGLMTNFSTTWANTLRTQDPIVQRQKAAGQSAEKMAADSRLQGKSEIYS